MFWPIKDDNPTSHTPIVTWALMFICVLVFIWQSQLTQTESQITILSYGIIPAHLFSFGNFSEINPMITPVPAWVTIFTSMFLHGGWMHLGGNMLFLWIFGDNVESAMGRTRFLIFYLLCGVIAAFGQSISDPGSTVPMIGASGAVSGVLGAYLILYPYANVKVLIWLLFFVTIINVPAWIVLGFWFIGQLLSQAGSSSADSGIAFLAHIFGFIGGLLLVFKMRKKGVVILKKRISKPFSYERRKLKKIRIPNSGE